MLNAICALPKAIVSTTLELVYPRSCCVCGSSIGPSESASLCATCHKRIRYNKPLLTASAKRAGYYFDRVHSVAAYEGVMRECIHKFKYNGMLSVEKLFVELMTDYAGKYIDKNLFDFIIPVPLYRTKLRERSFNQAAILANFVSRKLKIPCINNNLIRIRAGKPQIDLLKRERLKNIKGVFKLKRPLLLNDKSVLLIDDVFTTGATLNECSRVLKLAGAGYIEAFTLAQGM